MSIQLLPDEIIEMIVNFLNNDDKISFARSHVGFGRIIIAYMHRKENAIKFIQKIGNVRLNVSFIYDLLDKESLYDVPTVVLRAIYDQSIGKSTIILMENQTRLFAYLCYLWIFGAVINVDPYISDVIVYFASQSHLSYFRDAHDHKEPKIYLLTPSGASSNHLPYQPIKISNKPNVDNLYTKIGTIARMQVSEEKISSSEVYLLQKSIVHRTKRLFISVGTKSSITIMTKVYKKAINCKSITAFLRFISLASQKSLGFNVEIVYNKHFAKEVPFPLLSMFDEVFICDELNFTAYPSFANCLISTEKNKVVKVCFYGEADSLSHSDQLWYNMYIQSKLMYNDGIFTHLPNNAYIGKIKVKLNIQDIKKKLDNMGKSLFKLDRNSLFILCVASFGTYIRRHFANRNTHNNQLSFDDRKKLLSLIK